jgi:hypothetical protein
MHEFRGELAGRQREVLRAAAVGAQRFGFVRLGIIDACVRRGVEHDVRPFAPREVEHGLALADVDVEIGGDDRHAARFELAEQRRAEHALSPN